MPEFCSGSPFGRCGFSASPATSGLHIGERGETASLSVLQAKADRNVMAGFFSQRKRDPGARLASSLAFRLRARTMRADVPDYEDLAAELRSLAQKVADLRERMNEVEKVNARLEGAALSTSRALADISRHWDAVYEAMRREEEASDQ
jgi:hypothetical protein